jgi:hypothetical protein
MAKLKLRFRIVNASVGWRELAIEHDGEPAVVKQEKLFLDCEPLDGTEKTLELVLPAKLAAEYPEGAIICASLEVVELPSSEEA